MSSISTGTTTTTGYVVASDTTGTLVLKTGASATTAVTIDTSQNATFAKTANLPNTFGFKNRIINGAMVISQGAAGASVTPLISATYAANYAVDRFITDVSQTSKITVEQNAGSVTPPVGFSKYLGITVGAAANVSVGASDYFILSQKIEGNNIADLAWGTANAQTVTLSFWVRSSVTGTFGGCIRNGASNRSYPFTYTVSSSNTWTQISVSIPGDTTGTWSTDNTTGMFVFFSLGSGSTYSGTASAWAAAQYVTATGVTNPITTNSATFYITGVQLEVGTVATSFDYRSIGTETSLCQRYFWKTLPNLYARFGLVDCLSTTGADCVMPFPVQMRTTPSLSTTGTAGNYAIYTRQTLNAVSALSLDTVGTTALTGVVSCASTGLVAGSSGQLVAFATTAAFLSFSAEL